MFFYIFHNIVHYGVPINENIDSNGAKNVRTIIFGGICYIILHAYLYNESCPYYQFRHYLYYLLLLDIFVMGITYKLYYGRSMLNELHENETDEYDEKRHKYIKNNNIITQTNILNDKTKTETKIETEYETKKDTVSDIKEEKQEDELSIKSEKKDLLNEPKQDNLVDDKKA